VFHVSFHLAWQQERPIQVQLRDTEYTNGEPQANTDTRPKNSLLLIKKASDKEGTFQWRWPERQNSTGPRNNAAEWPWKHGGPEEHLLQGEVAADSQDQN
jgi:hypothetical protein